MATTQISSENKADQIAVPAKMIPSNELHGRVRMFLDKALTAVGDAGSTITFAKLPKGAKVLFGWLYGEAETAAITYALGDGTTADKFLAATVYTAAALTPFPAVAKADAVYGYDMSEKSFVVTTAVSAMGGGKKVTVVAFYVVD